MSEIIILTGKIGSGKTTTLINWAEGRKKTGGLLTITKNGKRHFRNIHTGEEIPFEAEEGYAGKVIPIGRFTFKQSAFDWAEKLFNSIDYSSLDYLLLDEIGLIELKDMGFHNLVVNILEKIKDTNIKTIFVVREDCVDKVIEKYCLKNVSINSIEKFNSSFFILNSSLKSHTGYILCGGRSKRFGSDKALVKIDGRAIVEIVAAEMKKVFDEVLLVTAKPEKYNFVGIESITDIYRNCGPLAGIHTALKNNKREKIFVVSCDLPLISADVIRYIAEYKTDKEIIIPSAGGKMHYLCGVYNKSVLWRAQAILEQTKDMPKCASPFDLINITGYELIDFDKLNLFDSGAFFNLNTQEDLGKVNK